MREELEEAKAELATLERTNSYRMKELEAKQETLQKAYDDARNDLDAKVTALQSTQQKLSQKEAEVGQIEAQVLQLKAQGGDSDELSVVKRELSEQVAHIKKLESTNRQQLAELKELRKQQKSVQVVEEEKRDLEGKLRMMNDLRRELGEAQLKQQLLEDERKSWTAYLESQSSTESELQFDSPEDMARAFIRERLENASLMERLGAVQPELAVKEENIKALEDEKAKILAELEKAKASGAGTGSESKLRARLERQKVLANKEVEYLRAQVKTFEEEEKEFNPERGNEERAKQIQELENIVNQYRSEVESLHKQLTALEQQGENGDAAQLGKRRRDSADDERLGELRRKNRQLQDELSQSHSRVTVLETEAKAHESQLKSLKATARTRVLELRSNPTAQAEAIKLSTLKLLKDENQALLAQLEGKLSASGKADSELVPLASLESTRAELEEMGKTLERREKKEQRLKQIFSAKSTEFREAVFSILGWKMDFMPNGRVRVTSMYYPGDEENGDGGNSIVFDGENGTMKVSGGPQSEFAMEIRSQIEYWVEGRKEIPCFLAALTMEFYERFTRVPRA